MVRLSTPMKVPASNPMGVPVFVALLEHMLSIFQWFFMLVTYWVWIQFGVGRYGEVAWIWSTRSCASNQTQKSVFYPLQWIALRWLPSNSAGDQKLIDFQWVDVLISAITAALYKHWMITLYINTGWSHCALNKHWMITLRFKKTLDDHTLLSVPTWKFDCAWQVLISYGNCCYNVFKM